MVNENYRLNLRKSYEKIYFDDFSDIFRHVRRVIDVYLNKTRPGIMLGLVELGFNRGNFIGGLHYGGTNEIYLNKSSLKVMKEETEPEKYKAYVYFVLLHEYIHSVGFMNEATTRKLTKEIILDLFGNEHVLGNLANFGLNYYFPYSFNQKRQIPTRKQRLNPEYVTLHHIENEYGYI